MKLVIYGSIILISLLSCTSRKVSGPIPNIDSVEGPAADCSVSDSLVNPPKSADGLFDDFIYSFMRNPRFQSERIVFPLKQIVYGKECLTEKLAWKHNDLYVKQDVYTLIFDGAKSLRAEKDTSLRHVVVEMIQLKQQVIMSYHFEKQQGQWMLAYTQEQHVSENVNADFLQFYVRFATSAKYQTTHIDNPFHFKTYDYENFQDIEGLLDVEQWPDYRPTLPHGVITNINYGQQYANSKRRILMVCSQSGGMGCSLFFVKRGGRWMLNRLEN